MHGRSIKPLGTRTTVGRHETKANSIGMPFGARLLSARLQTNADFGCAGQYGEKLDKICKIGGERTRPLAAQRVDDLHRINGITTYCTHQTSGRIHEYAGIRKAIPVTTPNHQIHVLIENRFGFALSDDGAPW